MMDPAYIEAVRLLLEAIPTVFQAPRLAMKGGPAINLFIQDLPRLSVDIDVVFVDHRASREDALRLMGAALEQVRKELSGQGLQVDAPIRMLGDESKLFVRRGRRQVKVEVNHVFRGTMLPVQPRSLTAESRRLFAASPPALWALEFTSPLPPSPRFRVGENWPLTPPESRSRLDPRLGSGNQISISRRSVKNHIPTSRRTDAENFK
jgi:hypothetical protein